MFFTQVYLRISWVMLTSWWMLCVFYSGVPPHQLGHVDELVEPLEQSVWELLYSRCVVIFGFL